MGGRGADAWKLGRQHSYENRCAERSVLGRFERGGGAVDDRTVYTGDVCAVSEVYATGWSHALESVQVHDGVCLYRYKQASLGLVSAGALQTTSGQNKL